MADPFVAEVRIFPFNFAPKGWAWCNGQLLPISQNTALFSLLGTMYGGDGKSTFALPGIEGSAVIQPGQGPGLSLYDQGQVGGLDFVTLLQSEIPSHTHNLMGSTEDGVAGSLTQGTTLANSIGGKLYQTVTNTGLVPMNFNALTPTGGDQPHNNLMPYLTLYFNIALQGVFPPRT
jgi:microcystin-dependent protein